MSFFESETKKAYKGHFANLLVMAMSDGEFDPAEQAMIAKIAERLQLTEEDINAVLKNPKKWKFRVPRSTKARIEILTDYVLVMISDGEIAPEEAAFCSYIAQQLELDPDTVIPMILDKIGGSAGAKHQTAEARTSIDSEAFLSDRGTASRRTPPPIRRDQEAQSAATDQESDEVRFGDFAVSIVEGEKAPGDYFLLDHDQQYSIEFRNYSNRRCDAVLEVDGKDMGTFRIQSLSSIRIDRPAHEDGRFTFYELMSQEGKATGLKMNQNLGLVKVTFLPELEENLVLGMAPRPDSSWADDFFGSENESPEKKADDPRPLFQAERIPSERSPDDSKILHSAERIPRAGGTSLSGKSVQSFNDAESIAHDLEAETIVYLRLGARVQLESRGPRELKPHPRSNKIPPPLS